MAGLKSQLTQTKDIYETVAAVSSIGGAATAPVTAAAGTLALGAESLAALASENPSQESAIVAAGTLIGSALVKKATNVVDVIINTIPDGVKKKLGESLTSLSGVLATQATEDAVKEVMTEQVKKDE